jgi:hypothetical protein
MPTILQIHKVILTIKYNNEIILTPREDPRRRVFNTKFYFYVGNSKFLGVTLKKNMFFAHFSRKTDPDNLREIRVWL